MVPFFTRYGIGRDCSKPIFQLGRLAIRGTAPIPKQAVPRGAGTRDVFGPVPRPHHKCTTIRQWLWNFSTLHLTSHAKKNHQLDAIYKILRYGIL
jgi:hypothetical protein